MATKQLSSPQGGTSLDLYWQEIMHFEPLSRQRENQLFQRIRLGDEEARQEVVKANLRFVLKVAKEYETEQGPSMIELVSEGNVGLMEAIERFDETRGFKFITYAVWWIRQAINKALNVHNRAIRLPSNQINDLRQMEKKASRLSQQLGRTPTFDEVAEYSELSPERLQSVIEASKGDISFDAPVDEEGNTSLLSFYQLQEDETDQLAESPLEESLSRCLNVLDEREFQIVQSYFGLAAQEPQTLQAIGQEMGLTRERVRQLRNRALDKIRAEHGENLIDYSRN